MVLLGIILIVSPIILIYVLIKIIITEHKNKQKEYDVQYNILYEKYKKENDERIKKESEMKRYDQQFAFRQNVIKTYQKIIDRHFYLMNEINQIYSIAINQPTIKNQYTEKCKKLCKEDIALSKDYIEYLKKYYSSYDDEDESFIGSYPSFSTLAKIYEKEQNYQKGIIVCISALKIGYKLDTSKGGIQGRLARLIKKYNKQTGDNVSYDYKNNILYSSKKVPINIIENF